MADMQELAMLDSSTLAPDGAVDALNLISQVSVREKRLADAVGKSVFDKMSEYRARLTFGSTPIRPGPSQVCDALVDACKALEQLVEAFGQEIS